MIDDDSARLLDAATKLIEAARRAGADAADAAVVRATSRGVTVRLGQVEEVEAAESDDVTLRVFVDGRYASVSATRGSDASMLAARAVAMARAAPRDPFAGLADATALAEDFADLDLFDPAEVSSARLTDDARALEDAARAVEGVSNSGGASAGAGSSGLVLATSAGFSGSRRRTGFSRSVSVVAGEGTGMQRDYDFDSRVHFDDLENCETIGRRAGERTVARLSPRSLPTGRMPVIFDRRTSKSLIGHLLTAASGAAIARKTSFLKDRLGSRVLPAGLDLVDDPLIRRRGASRPFDGEGVRGERVKLVEDGILAAWLLDSASARELGLRTNGRAARSGGGTSPSATNVRLTAGTLSRDALFAETGRALYVTELIGHGADLVTGNYSRGASGFLIEDGALAYPVSELTIAGDLSAMLGSITPADDPDERHTTVVPTLRVAGMTVAGRSS